MVFCLIVLLAFLATAELNPVSVSWLNEVVGWFVCQKRPLKTFHPSPPPLDLAGETREEGEQNALNERGEEKVEHLFRQGGWEGEVKRIHDGEEDTPPEDEEDHAAPRVKGGSFLQQCLLSF